MKCNTNVKAYLNKQSKPAGHIIEEKKESEGKKEKYKRKIENVDEYFDRIQVRVFILFLLT